MSHHYSRNRVRDLILTALDSPAMARRLHQQQPDISSLDEEARDNEARMEELAAAWAAGEINRKEWMTARAVLEQKVTRARTQLRRRDSRAPLRAFIGTYDEMLDRWERSNVSQRRAVVSSVLRSIMVMPADRARRWDPGRFQQPEWIVNPGQLLRQHQQLRRQDRLPQPRLIAYSAQHDDLDPF
ncbi:MAG: hypothetical protein JO272_11340 [Pseudonocardiales bacterium]|nr:hypothetical protein [Pseudonocardiales bacterium]